MRSRAEVVRKFHTLEVDGSNPSSATMSTIFKYNNKYYQAINLDKKLKRLKISKEDIEVLFEGELSQSELEKKFLELTKKEETIEDKSWHNPKLYYFTNIKTNATITSIYDNLDNFNDINANDWIRT